MSCKKYLKNKTKQNNPIFYVENLKLYNMILSKIDIAISWSLYYYYMYYNLYWPKLPI